MENRYLFQHSIKNLPMSRYDALIIGGGIAGLFAALHMDPSMHCAVATKLALDQSNSALAQGGIASVITPDDKLEWHIHDTLVAGAGLCDENAVKTLVTEGPETIRELIALGVPFDRDDTGELLVTREGGHNHRRIVHCGGDATGRETTKQLAAVATKRENLTFLYDTYLIDLLTENHAVYGAIVLEAGVPKVILSPNILLCTGGIGQIYRYTTNPRGAIGDGMICAKRAGAKLRDMEMVQFHPTTLISHKDAERLFLISEAVRGEGGILRNRFGEAFMQGKHPLADLAPRDIVTREILKELQRIGDEMVYLDVSSMSEAFFLKRFPTISHECRSLGIRVPFDLIPVRPAQHYQMGGIYTDFDGRTGVEGLYACGEAASTGIHGGNRLASNSILECLVFGRRAARDVIAAHRTLPAQILLPELPEQTGKTRILPEQIESYRMEIKKLMSKYAGAIRTVAGMESALLRLAELRNLTKNMVLETRQEYELYNMIDVALEVLNGALARKESVGAHYVVG